MTGRNPSLVFAALVSLAALVGADAHALAYGSGGSSLVRRTKGGDGSRGGSDEGLAELAAVIAGAKFACHDANGEVYEYECTAPAPSLCSVELECLSHRLAPGRTSRGLQTL